jgi:hypothetical protein
VGAKFKMNSDFPAAGIYQYGGNSGRQKTGWTSELIRVRKEYFRSLEVTMLRMGVSTTKGHPLEGSREIPGSFTVFSAFRYLGGSLAFPPQEQVSCTLRSVPER